MTQNTFDELIKFLASTPEKVRRLAERFAPNETRWNPPGGEFSVVENVCHLRDIEVDGYAIRIKRILTEDQPILGDVDGAKLARERDYNNQELSSAMEAFAKAREENVRGICELTSEQLARNGTLENMGTITLYKLLELMREHDDVHVGELTSLRATLAGAETTF